MPSSGRHWEDFLLQTQGAAAGAEGVALRGGAEEAADTTVDGASTRLSFGSAAGSAPPVQDEAAGETDPEHEMGKGDSGRGFEISEAAVSNVRVVAGDAAADGARASVETETGGNTFHGQTFVFDRQNTWGARNPFTQWLQNVGTAAAPNLVANAFTPPDQELAWGAGGGGRIRRDKLFWYAALDGYNRNDPGVASVRNFAQMFAPVEPTSAQVLQLSVQLGETQNQAYEDYMGIPRAGVQAAGLEQLAGLLGPAPRTASQWLGFARLDWQAAERHRIALEANAAEWNAPGGGVNVCLKITAITASGRAIRAASGSWRNGKRFSPRICWPRRKASPSGP